MNTERQTERRAARVLAADGLKLRKCRTDSRWLADVGRYYAINKANFIAATHLDVDALAAEAQQVTA